MQLRAKVLKVHNAREAILCQATHYMVLQRMASHAAHAGAYKVFGRVCMASYVDHVEYFVTL